MQRPAIPESLVGTRGSFPHPPPPLSWSSGPDPGSATLWCQEWDSNPEHFGVRSGTNPGHFGVSNGIQTWGVLNTPPKLRAGSDINFIQLFVRTMADQDELVQVGFETTMLEESMAQDDSFGEDRSLQP